MIHDLVVFEDFLLDVDIAMLGILGVQDIGSVLLELDTPLAQQAVQGHGTAHPKLFGDLRCRIRFSDMGKDGHTSLSLHTGLALFLQLGRQLDQHIRVEQGFFQLFGREIAAVLTDGGKHFMNDPSLEGLGFRLTRTEDEGIQTGLGNDGHFLLTAKGVDKGDTLFIVIKRGSGITAIADLQAVAYILSHKPRRATLFHNPDLPEFLVFENLRHLHGRNSFCKSSVHAIGLPVGAHGKAV